jgi:hypothetical protein
LSSSASSPSYCPDASGTLVKKTATMRTLTFEDTERYPADPFFQSEGFQILSALQASLMIMMLATSKKFLAIQASLMVLLLTTRKFLSLVRWSWFQMLT